MNFTDRFIKLPIKIYDKKHAELVGNATYEDSWMKINPFEISEYKPTIDTESDNQEATYVSMKNGVGFFCYLTISKFEELLNKNQL